MLSGKRGFRICSRCGRRLDDFDRAHASIDHRRPTAVDDALEVLVDALPVVHRHLDGRGVLRCISGLLSFAALHGSFSFSLHAGVTVSVVLIQRRLAALRKVVQRVVVTFKAVPLGVLARIADRVSVALEADAVRDALFRIGDHFFQFAARRSKLVVFGLVGVPERQPCAANPELLARIGNAVDLACFHRVLARHLDGFAAHEGERLTLILVDALDGELVAVGSGLLSHRLRGLLLRTPEALKELAQALGRGGIAAKKIALAAFDAQPSALLLDGGAGELALAANSSVRANLVTIGARNGIVGSKRRRHIAVVCKPHQRRLHRRSLRRLQRRIRRAVDVPLAALVGLDGAVVHRAALGGHVLGVLEERESHALHVVALAQIVPGHQGASLVGSQEVVGRRLGLGRRVGLLGGLDLRGRRLLDLRNQFVHTPDLLDRRVHAAPVAGAGQIPAAHVLLDLPVLAVDGHDVAGKVRREGGDLGWVAAGAGESRLIGGRRFRRRISRSGLAIALHVV